MPTLAQSYLFLPKFNYMRIITIDNTQNSNTLTDYQVLVNLDTSSLIASGRMRSDCGDIRFYDSDGVTSLNYWLEGPCNSSSTRIWVKIPSIPASSKKTIYLFYGNSSLTSASNGSATFDAFDDFLTNTLSNYVQIDSGWSINTTPPGYLISPSSGQGFIGMTMTLSRAYALRAKMYMGSSDVGPGFIWGSAGGSESSVNGYIANYYVSSTYSNLRIYSSGSFTSLASLPTLSSGWYIFEIRITSSTIEAWRDTTKDASASDTTFSTLNGIGFRQKSASTYAVDWWALRKYIPPEPTVSLGSEIYIGRLPDTI